MAKNLNDHLSLMLNETTHSHRHDYWLWLQLIQNNYYLPPYELDKRGMRDKMASVIATAQAPNIVEKIKTTRNEQLVPINELNWITDEKRQVKWLLSKIESHTGPYGFIPPTGMNEKDLLIVKVDLWAVDLTQKKLALNDLKAKWNEHKKGDGAFKWFKDDNQKCILAWEWLNKNASLPISTYPHQPFGDYEDLLIFFDKSQFIPDQKTLYIEKIKRKWSQQKYRQSLTGKAQYNFILSDKAIKRLDSLAETYDRSRTQILETLLKMESEKNLYMPEQIRIDKSY